MENSKKTHTYEILKNNGEIIAKYEYLDNILTVIKSNRNFDCKVSTMRVLFELTDNRVNKYSVQMYPEDSCKIFLLLETSFEIALNLSKEIVYEYGFEKEELIVRKLNNDLVEIILPEL